MTSPFPSIDTAHRARSTRLLTAFAACLLCCGVAAGQVVEFEDPDADIKGIPNYRITFAAADPQPPILRYALLPRESERQPGNAAPLYYRAILSASQAQSALPSSQKFWNDWDKWMNMPMSEIPADEVEQALAPFQQALQEMTFAARRSTCEWDFPVVEAKTQFFDVLMNEVQECRTLANILGLRIRLRLSQGRIDKAVADLQTGYSLARDVGNRGFIVNYFVGIAIAGRMDEQVLELIATEGSPNLYWPLTTLPNPLISERAGVELENSGFRATFPEIFEALDTNGNNDPGYWNERLRNLLDRWILFPRAREKKDDEVDLASSLAYQALTYSQAPRIKRELIERFGRSADEVDSLPDSRALLLHAGLHFEEEIDAYVAPLSLPYYEASTFFDAQTEKRFAAPVLVPAALAAAWVPSLEQVVSYKTRAAEKIAILRIIESIRSYAAGHGELPTRLDELKLPISDCPYAGQPFQYQRDEHDPRVARLWSAAPVYHTLYELHLRQPQPVDLEK